MKQFLIIVFFFYFKLNCLGQKDSLIFVRKSDKDRIAAPIPYLCEVSIHHKTPVPGKIINQTDSTFSIRRSYVLLELKQPIQKNPLLSEKEKKFKLDSIYNSEANVLTIHKKDFSLIKFRVKYIRPKKHRQLFYASTALFIASGFAVIASSSPSVTSQQRDIVFGAFVVSTGTFIYCSKKRIKPDKWDIQ